MAQNVHYGAKAGTRARSAQGRIKISDGWRAFHSPRLTKQVAYSCSNLVIAVQGRLDLHDTIQEL